MVAWSPISTINPPLISGLTWVLVSNVPSQSVEERSRFHHVVDRSFIRPDYRSKTFGRSLIECMESPAPRRGVSLLTYLGNDLELLSLSDILRLGDDGLQLLDGPVVEGLLLQSVHCSILALCIISYRSAGDDQLNLSTVCAHELGELLSDALENA